jgi:glycosyltransferase involved in cell wall biosynthesis
MRVLFMITKDWLNPSAAGGHLQECEYARYLASVGHDVTLLTSTFPAAAKEEVREGITITRLGQPTSLWWRTMLHYTRHCRNRFDVVVEEAFGGARIPRCTPLYVREPIVAEWHHVNEPTLAYIYPRILVGPGKWIERATVRLHRHSWVRAGTMETREALIDLGFRRDRVVVVPVSLRSEWFADPAPIEGRPARVVWLGSFTRWKCADHIVRALERVVREVPECTLVMAGKPLDRRLAGELKEIARQLGLSKRVEFRFDIGEEEKRRLLESARLLVMSSPIEGFGIVALEAGACGTPVVASSGVPESVVNEGYNGLRYPFGNLAALASSVCRLLRDDSLHARLAAANRRFARGFEWRQVGQQFERLLGLAARQTPGDA